MTCREKLKLDRPELSDLDVQHIVNVACPSDSCHGYMCDPEWCHDMTIPRRCSSCWDREIPGTKNVETIKEEKETMNNDVNTVKTKKTKTELLNEIAELKKELENLDKYCQYENIADELAGMRDAFIAKGFTREEAISFIFNAMNSLTK